jgi:GT2 family glycosyltransferase
MNGKGVEYLEYSFNVLYSQTYTEFEIIISDHSISDEIKDLCEQWSKVLDIKYFRNQHNRGVSSANINNAIKHANGKIIKILFQDDFLYDEFSLETQLKIFTQSENYWMVSACCHYDGVEVKRPLYPRYHDNIQYGENTISSPSVLMFKNINILHFDENLFWLMDVDYYKRLYDTFGYPAICHYITVVNREHPYQVSNTLATEEVKRIELDYIIKKYEKKDI